MHIYIRVIVSNWKKAFDKPDTVSANANRCDHLVVVDRLSQLGRWKDAFYLRRSASRR